MYHEGAVLHFQGAPGARAVIDFVYGHALISCHALVVKGTIRLWNTIRSSPQLDGFIICCPIKVN